jgi:pyruvate dehydrogenase E1 component alpha subunit
LNLAKIYHLPIIYFVVNNQYGMGLRVDQGSAVSELYRKGCAFDIRGERVDGTDVLAVREAVLRAVKVAREEHEPYLIEAVSYRFRGHSVVDPDRYRDEEEVRRGREQDPILIFGKRLQEAGLLDEAGMQKVEEQVEQEIEEAVRFAEASPFPAVDTLFDYIYAPDDAQTGEN